MAVDKLIDSTKLDACCTAEANAIRAKTGGSSQLAYDWANDKGFADAIAAIPSGGTNAWAEDVARLTISLARDTLPAGNLILDFPEAILGISNFLTSAIGGSDNTEITVNAKQVVGSTTAATITADIANIMQNATKIKKITINATKNPSIGSGFIYNNVVQKVIGTPLICTNFGAGATSRRFSGTALTEVYLVPNKVSEGGVGINTGVLIDASLVSFANALKDGVTGQTFTILNATTKARCSTLMGTVSQVTEDGVTYNFFTQNDDGTVSLADFITNTKGWSLA